MSYQGETPLLSHKTCTRCGLDKPRKEFYREKSSRNVGRNDLLVSRCIPCCAIQGAQQRARKINQGSASANNVKKKVSRLKVGSKVSHYIHGTGTITEAWSTFWACTNCFSECPSAVTSNSRTSPCCNHILVYVPATGTFGVKFERITHYIHQDWLTNRLVA